MKIIRLTAENIKRLTAVEITPEDNLVQITGRNGQGKTSVLDSIWWALAGTKHIQASPIRTGQKKARVKLELGEITVERRFTRVGKDGPEYNTALVVTNADGARYPSPQTMLDALLGELSFDPLGFVRSSPKEQLELLKRFVEDIDLDQLAAENQRDYQARTDFNRRAKEFRAQAKGISSFSGERVDADALLAELEEAHQHNNELERRADRREAAARQLKSLELQVKDMERALKALKAERDEVAEKLKGAEELPPPRDTVELNKAIREAREQNERVDAAERRAELLKRAELLEQESEALTEAMQARDQRRLDAIAAAKLPIEGLSLGEDAVLFSGVPLEQASDAEQLRVGVAVAAALNPKLRVIRARDGSLLDSEGLKLLAEFARENDMQVWVERVAEDGAVGFVVEDGHLKDKE